MHSFDDRVPRSGIGSPARPGALFAIPLTKLAWIGFLVLAGPCSAFAQTDSEERAIGAFSKLAVSGGIDVYLTQSSEPSLRVEVDGYDLDDVVTEVKGDELRLSRARGALFFGHGGRVTVYLNFVQLSAIEASGGSDIHGRDDMQVERLTVHASGGSDVDLAVQAQRLEFVASGGSDLRLRGRTPSLDIVASGGCDVSARSLQSDDVKLVVSGGSDAIVTAGASIDINAHGGSDVSVYGNPAQRTVDNDRSSDVAWR
jgi:hypothetical protein